MDGEPWTVPEILTYLEHNGIAVALKDGKPSLFNTKGKEEALSTVLPHLKEQRQAIIAHFMKREQCPITQRRLAILGEVRKRAAKAGRPIYVLHENGTTEHISERAAISGYALPDTVTYLAVERELEWTALPTYPKTAEEISAPARAREKARYYQSRKHKYH